MKKFFWILELKVWDFISDYGKEKLSHKGGYPCNDRYQDL